MSTQMQLRGGTTAENLLFTGAQREVTVDTDKNTLVVHDGVTPGGFTLASEGQVADSTYFYVDDTAGGSAANAYILVPQANTNQPNSYMNGIVLGFTTGNVNTGASTANFQGLGVKNIKYRDGTDPAAGDIFGRITVIYDETADWLELQRKPGTPLSQVRSILGSVSGNALTVTLTPTTVDFRSPTGSNGAVNSRTLTANTSLIVPAGATLGTVSGVLSTIVIVAIDNGGAVELAVINQAGGVTLDETALINTTAISAGATSATTFYSQNARVGVPYRVVGMVQSTQAAAGTWSATPTKVQGQGGQAIFDQKNRLFMSAVQNTTSGTAIDFTGIPSGVNRMSINFSSLSTSGTNTVTFQLGAGSVDSAGYVGVTTITQHSTLPGVVQYTTGITCDNATAATSVMHGSIIFTRISANTWTISGTAALSNTGRGFIFSGAKALSGTLDRIRITTAGGTDTFDGGTASINWEL
ncbi:hypothetical protein HU742_018065 [Pseudomonas sp. SWRI102]|uniref:Major tropism determinant N-terminal domain-containing protein n=1 Tax=Pseudomonas marvdashtae TaxID=2745500 RepID=A0A923FNJ5_9PSED|nr:hypothetical protein [Pseudomonas marvdashtae]MBV4553054.1 hypothetical protein [Pseudomonas marvdashtae]